MASDDVRIRVRVDTTQAKSGLRELRRSQSRAYRDGRLRRLARRGFERAHAHVPTIAGAVGGFSAIRRITGTRSVGNVDPWAEAMVPIQATAQALVDEKLGYSAKARNIARLEIAQLYAMDARGGKIPDHVRRVHSEVLAIRELEQKGLNILRQDPRFTGPSLSETLEQALSGYLSLIGRSFDDFKTALGF